MVANLLVLKPCIYLGKAYEEHVEKTKRIWEEILPERGDFQFCIVKIPNERSLLAVIYDYKNLLDIERRVQYRILQERQYQCQLGNIGWILADNLQGIKESFYKIYNAIDWNITLGSGVIVNYYKISQLRTILCVYPLEIENEIKTALCIGERKKVEEGMERFHQYFKESSLYLPKDIKQCYVRMIWAVINVAKEVNTYMSERKLTKEMADAFVDSIIIHGKYEYEIKLVYDDQFADLQKLKKEKEAQSR